MPQKRKKHNFTGTVQQNETTRNIKSKQTERQWIKKPENALFTNEELQEIKTILKRKHLAKTPALISATVLNKVKVIENLFKKGTDVNEQDETGATALIWGVRTKKMDAIKLLLKSENVCLKSEIYDHVLFVALNLSNWNESEFYNLLTNVKALYPVGVNILSKDGRSMLHYAVEREWMGFINILISENADINIQDINGLTPIMLACVKRNLKIIEYFIELSVDLTSEDCSGLTALCYIISMSFKIENANFLVEGLLDDVQQTTMKNYVKSRLDLIADESPILYSTEPSLILLDVFKYLINVRNDGYEYLLEFEILEKIKKGILINLENISKLRFILTVAWELFKNESKQREIVELFISQGCLEAFIILLQKYKNIACDSISKISLKAIINVTAQSVNGKIWMETYFESIYEIIKSYADDDLIKILNTKEDVWTYNSFKTKQFLEYVAILHEGIVFNENLSNITPLFEDDSNRISMRNSRKSKRRSKALKVKIQKIKTAELAERLNPKKLDFEIKSNEDINWDYDIITSCSQEFDEQKDIEEEENNNDDYQPHCSNYKIYVNPIDETSIKPYKEDECLIVNSIKNFVLKDDVKSNNVTKDYHKFDKSPDDWKDTITHLPFVNVNTTTYDLLKDSETLLNYNDPKIYSQLFIKKNDIQTKLIATIKYLTCLLEKIIEEYHIQWQIDKELEREVYQCEKEATDMDNIITKLKEEKIEMLKTVFCDMISYIKEMSQKNIGETISLINNLENLLLNHHVRERTIKEDFAAKETVDVSVKFLNHHTLISNYTVENYMEDVLNNKRKYSENIVIKVIEPKEKCRKDSYKADLDYLNDIMKLQPKKPINSQKIYESKMETMKYPYHMVNTIMKLCDSDDESINDEKLQKLSSNNSTLNSSNKITSCDVKSTESSRWCSLVRSLELMEDCQTLLNDTVRMSCQSKRTSHVISTGGNFTPVELGLDSVHVPLAVKRIPKGSAVCTMIKNIISELLDVKHLNILQYCVCDYDKNELILATPLCEYNIGQYLMLMKQKKISSITTMEIVNQFLNGILYLHHHSPSIIHGNLKPSNIFIDLNGNVRIAEFGIHEALFKLKEAPNSSVIWFSTESYKNFKQTSLMQCSLKSDIQVVGMLIHFIFTGGTHAFGVDTKDILKNLEQAIPQLICSDLELQDLLTWMLLYYPNERPSIQQVLSHVFFWSMERRWQFILTCSGVTPSGGEVLIDLENFHYSIDKISFKDNIKGCWVQVMKRLIPNLWKSDDDDSPTGLLKFIRSCFKDRPPPIEFKSDFERCSFFITSFPTFPLSLYRMLQTTNEWLNHPVFLPYIVQK